MPNNVEAEQSVIGAMLMDRDAITIASEILTVDDFYQKQYGIIFDAMVELCNEGKPVDLITLQNRLKEKDLPPDISNMEYVRDLISAVPTSARVTTGLNFREGPSTSSNVICVMQTGTLVTVLVDLTAEDGRLLAHGTFNMYHIDTRYL